MVRYTVLAAAVCGALGVALGAFGAHWLSGAVQRWDLPLDEQTRRLEVWETAVRYQMYHALALLAVGLIASQRPDTPGLAAAALLFVVGVLIFSGCLYALVLTGVKILGAIVPIGGTCLILGWIVLAVATWRGLAQSPGEP